jgi:D-psicose/D-tagatose/L-ribulose 3-epimerase
LSGYNPIPSDLKLVGPDADRARQDAHLDLLLRRAAALELRFLIFNSGAAWRVPDGVSADAAFADLAAFARRFAEAAARRNITVLVEPLRSTDSNMITTVSDALRLITTVNHPSFALMVDYSFLRIQKEDMNALRDAGRHLRHVHIANPSNPRTYPMDPQESDYASFFRVLKEIGYRGGLSVHAGTAAFLTDAPRAIVFLRTQARELAR